MFDGWDGCGWVRDRTAIEAAIWRSFERVGLFWRRRLHPEQRGEVVGGVPPWFLVFIDPGWWNEFGYTIGGEDDRPVAFVDFGMMMSAQQTPVGVSTFAVM